jgi:hypothetical protein
VSRASLAYREWRDARVSLIASGELAPLWRRAVTAADRHTDTIMARFDSNNQFFTWICFSDEATFQLNGSVNQHNMRYWADQNPHWMRDCYTQYLEKVNVWAGILCNRIIGLFFIDGNVTAENYLNLLRKQIIPKYC